MDGVTLPLVVAVVDPPPPKFNMEAVFGGEEIANNPKLASSCLLRGALLVVVSRCSRRWRRKHIVDIIVQVQAVQVVG